jgi:hypothetical protein
MTNRVIPGGHFSWQPITKPLFDVSTKKSGSIKLEVVNELISPSHALKAPPFSALPSVLKRTSTGFERSLPRLRWAIEDIIAEKDKVVACWTYSGTHKGDYMGVLRQTNKYPLASPSPYRRRKIMDSHTNWGCSGADATTRRRSCLGRRRTRPLVELSPSGSKELRLRMAFDLFS